MTGKLPGDRGDYAVLSVVLRDAWKAALTEAEFVRTRKLISSALLLVSKNLEHVAGALVSEQHVKDTSEAGV